MADLLTIETDLWLKIYFLYSIFILKNGNVLWNRQAMFLFCCTPFSCTPHDAKQLTHSVRVSMCISLPNGEHQRAEVLSVYLCGLRLQSIWCNSRPNNCLANERMSRCEPDEERQAFYTEETASRKMGRLQRAWRRRGSTLQGLVCTLWLRDPEPATA